MGTRVQRIISIGCLIGIVDRGKRSANGRASAECLNIRWAQCSVRPQRDQLRNSPRLLRKNALVHSLPARSIKDWSATFQPMRGTDSAPPTDKAGGEPWRRESG